MTQIILRALVLLLDGHCPPAEYYSQSPSWDYSKRTGDVVINDCAIPTTAELPAAELIRRAVFADNPA